MSSANIQAAIAAAQAAAGNLAATANPGNLPVAGGATTAVAAQAAAGPLSFAQVDNGSMQVDSWLKVNEDGLKFGSGGLVEEFTAYVDWSQIQLFRGVRYGNPAQYKKTYNGVTTAGTGAPWAQTIADARAIDSRVTGDYPAADVLMFAAEDVVDLKKNTVAKAGDRIGISTSVTNWNNFKAFKDASIRAGMDVDPVSQLPVGKVKVRVGYEARQNKAGNNWGVVTWDLLEVVEEMEDAA